MDSSVLHVFTCYMYTVYPSAVSGVCVCVWQHYGVEPDIHWDLLSSGL